MVYIDVERTIVKLQKYYKDLLDHNNYIKTLNYNVGLQQ